MKKPLTFLALAALLIVFFALAGGFYVVRETQQVIVTQFGQPVGKPVTTAGLHLKIPLIQTVHYIDKRVQEWDGPSAEMPTKDKLYIVVDAFGRWRISDPLQYFLRLRDPRSAISRLDDVLGSELRNVVARHELVEVVRTTKDRKPIQDEMLASTGGISGTLPPIRFGRVALEREVADQAREKLREFGIELLDVRFKRINYNPAVSEKIFERMISERRQIAERFRSEGAGEAAKILGNKERELKQIESEAYRKVQGIQGKADAEATAIYAEAFNQSQEARDFYAFQRTLDVYRGSFQSGTTLLLSTDNGLLQLLKGTPETKPGTLAPAPVAQPQIPVASAPSQPQPLAPAPSPQP